MKRTSHAVDQRPGPATPAGDMAQPDERDLTPETEVNRKELGPRQVIEQAARDVGRGLKDTDLHGIPSNVPGPAAKETPGAEVPAEGGGRKTYAADQKAKGRGKAADKAAGK